jgi:glycosyltransferase involved in cell wall biosynthesis
VPETDKAGLAIAPDSGFRPGLVSIVIPFHETPPQFFSEAIESVRAQTYADWELLLASDGARGACVQIAERYSVEDRRITLLWHPGGVNRGHSATRNLGLAHARGEFVTFLDSDDLLLPHKLTEQVALLRAHPGAGMIYGYTEYWHSWTGEPRIRDYVPALGVAAGTLADPPRLLSLYLEGTAAVPCTCSVLARRDVVRSIGGFEDSFRALYGDQAFYAKMCLATPILVANGLWDRYRQHARSLTGSTRAPQEREHRHRFLSWLEHYLRQQAVLDRSVWRAVRREQWKLRHPYVARVLRSGRRLVRRITRSSSHRPPATVVIKGAS